MARIVLTTFGTLGDLHPYVALARELSSRGHRPLIATHASYGSRVEDAGIEFRPVRPDFTDFGDLAVVMRRAMDPQRGSDYIVRDMIVPSVRASFEDLLAASSGADAIVGHMLTFAAPIVAEKLGVPRIHTMLQPLTLFSAYDPPRVPAFQSAPWTYRFPPGVWKVLWVIARAVTRHWLRPVDELRAEVGLPRSPRHPVIQAHSPTLNLALFSPVLAAPQPDWPAHTCVTGFPFYDRDERGGGMSAALREFLNAGPAPVVFTLGSSGVWDAGDFYAEAAAAAHALGARAVLLTGPGAGNVPRDLGAEVLAVDYAPHSELFAEAAAIVHQGGIGTTGQALASGRPTLIIPFSHDQPDNAWRCAQLGVARVLGRRAARARAIERELRVLLADTVMRDRAAVVGARVRAEHGTRTAVDAIEAVLGNDRARGIRLDGTTGSRS